MLLDQVALKNEGFQFRVHHHPLDIFNPANEPLDSVAMICRLSKIRPNSISENLRLAYIENLPIFTLVEVAPWVLWHRL